VDDISVSLKNGDLPNALLFSGAKASGKLTAALELSRVLLCGDAGTKGRWDCACPSCLRHKQLSSSDVLVAGPRDCLPEIAAAQKTLLDAYETRASYVQAARFLFIRAVRKLTVRFSPALWGNDDKISKIAALVSSIEESLEEIEPSRELPPTVEKLKKITGSLVGTCEKLDSGFMYGALPVSHVRSLSSWARFTTSAGTKTVIIENAESMLETARNALLKILEEPPENTAFILTTANRGAMMPTILSRVRTYGFSSRTREQQGDVLKRVFHIQEDVPSIAAYLNSFLPVNPDDVFVLGGDFIGGILSGKPVNAKKTAALAHNFEPAALAASFFDGIIAELKRIIQQNASQNAAGYGASRAADFSAECLAKLNEAKTRMSLYNQNPVSALELLRQDIARAAKIC
jgi:DNA polymerase-3 subunit gamma/tau